MPYTKGKKPTKAETAEMFVAVRDVALEQTAAGVRRLGASESAIAKAKAECIAQNSDAPLIALAKSMLGIRR